MFLSSSLLLCNHFPNFLRSCSVPSHLAFAEVVVRQVLASGGGGEPNKPGGVRIIGGLEWFHIAIIGRLEQWGVWRN